MPASKVTNQATSADALATNPFREVTRPSVVSLFASGVTNSDTIGLVIGTRNLVVSANPNIEISADVVDNDRDMILFREPVDPGILRMPVTVTTAVNWILQIEAIA